MIERLIDVVFWESRSDETGQNNGKKAYHCLKKILLDHIQGGDQRPLGEKEYRKIMQKESVLRQHAEEFLEPFSNAALQGLWDELQADQRMLQEDYQTLKGLDADAWKSPDAKGWRFSEKGIKYEIVGIIGQAANKLLQKRTMSFGEKVESAVDSFFGLLARCLSGGRDRF
ncbi:MAG: hypothetical protein AB4426_25960 [Xenococcaceae cyanobacterium]